jgi:hypothetical protein
MPHAPQEIQSTWTLERHEAANHCNLNFQPGRECSRNNEGIELKSTPAFTQGITPGPVLFWSLGHPAILSLAGWTKLPS